VNDQEETDRRNVVHRQIGRYLLEQFSVPAFRSHVTIGLVDRDRIQFYHANHSVILVSSAIKFSTTDSEGLERFIAIIIAFSRLSLQDNGILHNLHKGTLFASNGKLPSTLVGDVGQIQKGNKLTLGDGSQEFTITYGNVISHEPSLAGRATSVLEAQSEKNSELVVKISWPGSKRVPENEFLEKAVEVARGDPRHHWALNHLPKVHLSQSVGFDSNSTHGKIANLFKDPKFVKRGYKYEERTLRIMVQERLYPLTTLKSAKEVAQVLLDIVCSE
jgi:hypothetical protein